MEQNFKMIDNTTAIILDDSTQTLNVITSLLTVLGLVGNLVSLVLKLCLQFVIPPTWKVAICLGDVANVFLGLGLSLFLSHASNQSLGVCNAAGFFIMFAIFDCLTSGLLSVVILQYIQNPVKISHFANYSKSLLFILSFPPKLLAVCVSFLPFIPVDYFDIHSDYPVSCFPVRESGAKSAEYGAVVIVLLWAILAVTVVLCIICAFRLWRSSLSRIHASSPDLWQTQLLGQGKTFQKFLLVEQTIWVITLFLLTLILYTNTTNLLVPQWIVYLSLSVVTTLHSIFSHLETGLWSTLCCSSNRRTKEPYQRLKKLELIMVEGTSKLRMKASWSLHKGVSKTGMLKVYGVNHVKSWSQEIVILGMLRKCHHPSILQCLWTSTSNPFFETMTLVSGQIITSDSRLICMELTNGGCLQKFLHHLDIPLPESCQQTILHDVAEGLSCLHEQNILHNNLSSVSIYLKGSIQCLVLRASLGDFENAAVYGSLQSGGTSAISKKQFFLPDIRAFALVALEILGVVCEKRLEVQSFHQKLGVQDLPENGDYFHYERPDSHLSSSIPDSYQLPNQIGVPKSTENAKPSHGKLLQKQTQIPTNLFVEKFVVDSSLAALNSHNQNSVLESDATKHLSVINPPDDRFSNHYVNFLTEASKNKSRPSSARGGGISPNPRQGVSASSPVPRSSTVVMVNPYLNVPNDQNRPPSASSNHSHRGYQSPRQSSQPQYVSGLVGSSGFYRSEDYNRDYEEIDDIAECIESEYYRKNMYPKKPVAVVTSYKERSSIPSPHPHQYSEQSSEYNHTLMPPTGGSTVTPNMNQSNIIHALTKPVPPKRNHAPSVNRPSSSHGAIAELLPGMVGHDTIGSTPSLKDLVKAKEKAKIEQHLESYQDRIDREIQEQKNNPSNKQNTKPNHKPVPQPRNKIPSWLQPNSPYSENQSNMVIPISRTQNMSNKSNYSRPRSAQQSTKAIQKGLQQHYHSRPQTATPRLLKAQEENQTVEISCEYQIPTVRVQSAKTSKARSNMKAAIHKNTTPQVLNLERGGKTNPGLEKKYSKFEQIGTIRDTFRRLKDKQSNKSSSSEIIQRNTMDNKNVIPALPQANQNTIQNSNVGGFSSFSSDDSFNSSLYKQSSKKGESLTSGEASSLSSQADMTSDQLEQSGYVTDTQDTGKLLNVSAGASMGVGKKLIDSGFDSASVSSGNLGVNGYSCSCPNSCNLPCSCQYANSDKLSSDTKTSWSNTSSVSSSLPSEKTLTESSRPSPDIVSRIVPDVIGPDEQYPKKGSKSRKSQKGNDREIFSKMHTKSLESQHMEKIGVASKKYQELAKRGVPLRVSVVSATQPIEGSDTQTDWSEFDSNYEAEIIEEDPDLVEAEEEYSDLDAQDFLDSLDSSSSRSSVKINPRGGSFKSGSVVNDVIREVPEESSCEDESKELLKSSNGKLVKPFEISSSSASEQRPVTATDNGDLPTVWDVERNIDAMFTKSSTTPKLESTIDPSLGVDSNAIHQFVPVNQLSGASYKPPVPVRKGLDTQHVKYCQQMASKMNWLKFEDLMPAHVDKFQVLRDKLEHEAKLGSVGVQLLDMIQKCWLNDSPPSTNQLVKQLRGAVTETEL